MRRLLLIRHAKSSWKFPDLDDHDRPLNARGERDKAVMTQYLLDHELALSTIYSSTAVRALALASVLSQVLNIPLQTNQALYTFGSGSLAAAIRQLEDSFQNIAVVAHNPAITELVNHLTKAGIANVPTSAIVAIKCASAHWSELSAIDCELEYFISPKMLN